MYYDLVWGWGWEWPAWSGQVLLILHQAGGRGLPHTMVSDSRVDIGSAGSPGGFSSVVGRNTLFGLHRVSKMSHLPLSFLVFHEIVEFHVFA